MKKLIYAISALAIVLAVGCSEDKVQTPEREYKLVVNMDKASLGDTTRVPRNSWLEGDEVMLFFGSDCSKWMTIKYDGNSWSIIDEDQSAYIAELAERENKSLTAIYCLHNEGELLSDKYGGFVFFDNYNIKANAYCGTLFMTCEDGSYSVEDDLFTINATLSLPDTSTSAGQFVQFTISNISNDENVDWFLSNDVAFRPCSGVGVSCDSDNKLSIDFYLEKYMPLQGYNSKDGVTFFGVLYAAAAGNPVNYNFTIVCISDEGEAKVFFKTFENKVLNRGSAVKFSGPSSEQCEIGIGETTTNGWERIM